MFSRRGLFRWWSVGWDTVMSCRWIPPSTLRSSRNFYRTLTNALLLSGIGIALVLRNARSAWCNVVSCVIPVGNVSWMLFQEGRSSKLRLTRGVGQAAHTRNKSEVFGILLSWFWVSSLPHTLILQVRIPFEILLQTSTGAQGVYSFNRSHSLVAR